MKNLIVIMTAFMTLACSYSAVLMPALGDLSNPGSLGNHAVIKITGDVQFTAGNGVKTGDGSVAHPYILENYTIDASNAHGIWIVNTNKHFVIRNCDIFNGTSSGKNKYGIFLDNAPNGTIEYNRVRFNYYGIYLKNSDYFILRYNLVFNSSYDGILLESTDKGSVYSNVIYNDQNGLVLSISNSNTVYNNSIYNAHCPTQTFGALYLWSSTGNIIRDNRLNSSDRGIVHAHSKINLYLNNTMDNNTYGFYFNAPQSPSTNFARLYSNKMLDNQYDLSILHGEKFYYDIPANNTIDGKPVYYLKNQTALTIPTDGNFIGLINCSMMTVQYQTVQGILLIDSDNISIRHASSHNAEYGLASQETTDIEVSNSTFQNNSAALMISTSKQSNHNFTVHHNTILNNRLSGIYVGTILGSHIYNNYVYNSSSGIGTSSDSIVENNTLTGNHGTGVGINWGSGALVRNNTISGSSTSGITIGDGYAVVTNNKVTGSGYGVYLQNSPSTITKNLLDNNTYGVLIKNTDGAVLRDNEVTNGTYGISMDYECYKIVLQSNTMKKNHYNLDVQNSPTWDPHNITSNNTVDGKPVRYWQNMKDKSIPANSGFIALIGCENITVKDIDIKNNGQGLILVQTNHTNVSNMNITDVLTGIVAGESKNNTYDNIHVLNGVVGISLGRYSHDSTISNCSVTNMSSYGMLIRGDWIGYEMVKVRVENSSVSDTQTGVMVEFCKKCGINDISINNSKFGLNVDCADDVIIERNHIVNSTFGANISSSSRAKFNFNVLKDLKNGPIFRYAYHATIKNNSVINSDYGMGIITCTPVTVMNNAIINSTVGLTYSSTSSSTIVNNRFDGSYYLYDFYQNTWNTEKSLSKNIVGGPYLGGNLWGSYHGTDSDGDWIGNDYVPFGPGDNYPLVIPDDTWAPVLKDLTKKEPTTGDNYPVDINAWDFYCVEQAWMVYQFDLDVYHNASMVLTNYDIRYSNYTAILVVPSNARSLNYTIQAKDYAGNWAILQKHREVLDNDPPTIEDSSSEPVMDGTFDFKANITDNLGVASMYLEYWFDAGIHTNTSFGGSNGTYRAYIPVGSNASTLHYIVSANDTTGNWAAQPRKDLKIQDLHRPQIKDISSDPTTGEAFSFEVQASDNVGIKSMWVLYSIDNGTLVNSTLALQNSIYTASVQVPSNATFIRYTITAMDPQGLRNETTIERKVIDNDAPTLTDNTHGQPKVNTFFVIHCEAADNVAISELDLEYWTGQGDYTTVEMTLVNTEYWYTLTIPLNASTLRYTLRAFDLDGNEINISRVFSVTDTIAPSFKDRSSVPTTGDGFNITVDIIENIGMETVTITYSTDAAPPIELEFNGTLFLIIPSFVKALYYNISGTDVSGISNYSQFSRQVIDNDLPKILDRTKQPTTGDDVSINADITDNIGLGTITITYWTDNGSPTTAPYVSGMMVPVPSNAFVLHYTLAATDLGGNTASSTFDRNILDNDPPVVIDRTTGGLKSGSNFKVTAQVTDNRAIGPVYVEYWFDNGPKTTSAMVQDGNLYTFEIPVKNGNRLNYVIKTTDSFNNTAQVPQRKIGPNSKDLGFNGLLLGLVVLILLLVIVVVVVLVMRRKKASPTVKKKTGPAKDEAMTPILLETVDEEE